MSKPVFSIVIPAYNSSAFLLKTIDCLKVQTFKDFEAIIINDGSTDGTGRVVSDYINSHENLNIRLITQENRGIAGARNRGILEAEGDFIAFLDHDDKWYPEKLEICYKIFCQHPEVNLVCHDEIIREISSGKVRNLTYGPFVSSMFKKLLFRGNCLSTSATVVKKEALITVGLFREYSDFATAEDYDLWLRLSQKNKFYFINKILGEYVINDRNASLNLIRHFTNQMNVIKSNFKDCKDKSILDYFFYHFRTSSMRLLLLKEFLRQKKSFIYY